MEQSREEVVYLTSNIQNILDSAYRKPEIYFNIVM